MKEDYQKKSPPVTKVDLTHWHDEFGRDHYATQEGRQVCGRLRSEKNRVIANEACQAPPMQCGACRVHGGKAGCPPKHGRYSRALTTWKGSFERALKDKDLLDTRRELALMDTTIEKLLERVEELDAPKWRAAVQESFDGLQRSLKARKQADVRASMGKLEDLIQQGAAIDQVSSDLMVYLDRRAARANKMSELALRREEKVTTTELALIFKSWLEVLEKELEQVTYFGLVEKLRRATESFRLPDLGGEKAGD